MVNFVGYGIGAYSKRKQSYLVLL